jgi:DNA-binding protein HU-beta
MNKKELIDAVASDTGFTKADCERTLISILGNMEKALSDKKDGNITLVGFGTFKTKRREAREERNPQTGAKIKIPAKNVVSFKAGKKLSESVN